MKSSKLIIKTKNKIYPIYFGKNIVKKIDKLIKLNTPTIKKICIVYDNKLPKKIVKNLTKNLKKYDVKTFGLLASEKNKSLYTVDKIIENLLKNNFNRTDCVIALGGGIIGDLAALISNLTKRGLKFINIPTTLLAQVDASIGGKTGINSNHGKNLIGTYYQPDFVISDTDMLKSLPKREMVSGYGEILKHSLILDKKFFLWLNKNGKKILEDREDLLLKKAIIISCKIKGKIITKDENEKNLRKILNFGHTFGHGFERAKNFSNKLNHGEAVLLGMLVASELSFNKKLLNIKDLISIKKHYFNLKLPNNLKKIFKRKDINKIVHFMKKDKKNTSEKISLILLKKIGKVEKFEKTLMRSSEIKKFLNSIYFYF